MLHFAHGTATGVWLGARSSAPSSESWELVSGMNDRVVRCELDTAKEIPERYRYFLADDSECNRNGVPRTARSPEFAPLVRPFVGVHDASFDGAIVRGKAFLLAVRAASPYVDEDAIARGNIVGTGSAAAEADIAALEVAFGPLPPSWRELFVQLGTIDISSAGGPTTHPTRVAEATAAVRPIIESLEELDDEFDRPELADWTKLDLDGGTHLPPLLRATRFLHFAEDSGDCHALAIDFRRADGECPILFLPHDEALVYLTGWGALDWVNRQIDYAIERIVRRSESYFV